jgi:hypothetical protein
MTIELNLNQTLTTISLPDQVWTAARTGLNAGGEAEMAEWIVNRLFQAGEIALTDSLRSQVTIDAD